jgi:hypothetical protein
MELTAENIVKRHDKYPESTQKLIESYAFQEYRKAVSDLFRFAKVVEVDESDTLLIVMTKGNFKNWRDLSDSHWYINNSVNLP